jgi:hypothetical protein
MFVVNASIPDISVENVFTRLENGQHFDCGIKMLSEQCWRKWGTETILQFC